MTDDHPHIKTYSLAEVAEMVLPPEMTNGRTQLMPTTVPEPPVFRRPPLFAQPLGAVPTRGTGSRNQCHAKCGAGTVVCAMAP